MRETVSFCELEEARITAGIFLAAVYAELGISERTWYRWKRAGAAPWWAYRILELQSGRLDALGWPGWEIDAGVLYCDQLRHKYHHWTPESLIETAKPKSSIPVASAKIIPFQPARAKTLKPG